MMNSKTIPLLGSVDVERQSSRGSRSAGSSVRFATARRNAGQRGETESSSVRFGPRFYLTLHRTSNSGIAGMTSKRAAAMPEFLALL